MHRYPITDKTAITRLPKRGAYDTQTVHAILDEALFCTLAYAVDNQSFQIATGFCRLGNALYIHGSSKSHYMRLLADSQLPVSVSVTLLDGIVLARSAFAHSMNYRSVVLFSQAECVVDLKTMNDIMKRFTEKMCKGRWQEIRKPTEAEWKATVVIRLPILEASAKIRTGSPVDTAQDCRLPVWAGVIPLVVEKKTPVVASQGGDAVPIPCYLK